MVSPLETLRALQVQLLASDGQMADAIGVKRQTWRLWKSDRLTKKGAPLTPMAALALARMLELRKIDPSNEALPELFRAAPPEVMATVKARGVENG